MFSLVCLPNFEVNTFRMERVNEKIKLGIDFLEFGCRGRFIDNIFEKIDSYTEQTFNIIFKAKMYSASDIVEISTKLI